MLLQNKYMKKIILIGLASIASSLALTAQAADANPPSLICVNLAGAWQVSDADKNDWIAATVPGCIHTDLLKAGKIPDPFYRDNESKVKWVGETDWKYKRAFQVSDELLQRDRVLLRCEGLDTLATIKINGKEVGRADNMFRTWEYDVKSALHAGANEIEITFASPFPYMTSRKAELPAKMRDRSWVRKEPCQFGWDWGPTLVTCGIYKKIALVAFDTARLADVLILQDHSQKGRVDLQVQVAAETTRASALRAVVSVRDNPKEVGTAEMTLADGKGSGNVTIKEPKIWWPNGMGEHPLYTVETRLLDANGTVLDQSSKRVGLRTLKLLPPDKATQTPLRFEVNGVQYFSKGANCIPFDSFNNRVTPEILRRYIADAAAANMNTLRFWGGGYYEEDEAFDACDEMGIVVWLDFKFACSGYPTFDNAFMENVKLEARDQLLRLRHHPSIGVWCGNNEIAMMKCMARPDYDKLFHELLGGQAKIFAPQANYVPGSPDCGDKHYWAVWHGGKPFEAYRDQSGFMSEFGLQSFPEPKSVRLYTDESDRASITSPVMVSHEKNAGLKGIGKIQKYLDMYFKPAKDFDSTLWLSQIMQAYGIKMGAESWRQGMPKSMGCVFWQYNDCWPVASWSSVDYYGRWKALQYAARRFYAPLLVSGLEHPDKRTVDVFVSSDRMEAIKGKVSWTATDVSGNVLEQGSKELEIPARKSQQVCTLDLGKQCQALGTNGVLTWLKLEVGGQTVSENLVLFTAPKAIALANPQIHADVTESQDGFLVSLTAQKPALWAWITLTEGDAKYSDNFVHLFPGSPKQILVKPTQPVSLDEFEKRLRVQSLFDTYSQ
jgi:beta-mannosidase